MGAFKPLLPFGERTVIECCLDYLREGGVTNIVVVLGHRADEIRDRLHGITVAINPDPTSEMGASVAAGIRALNDDAKCVLIALVDHPAIPATIVTELIAEWQRGAKIVIPSWRNRGGHPVLVDLSFRNELLSLDRSGGLRDLFKTHESAVKRLPVDSPFVARDMDTWDDYVALHRDVFGHPPRNP
jgi:CTP:molybdopterin cytidylyltransferase MocA